MDLSDPNLVAFMANHKPRQGRTLLVGSMAYEGDDRRSQFEMCIGLDMLAGPCVDLVHDLEDPLPHEFKFNHVDCCSVLEHVQRPWLMAENIERCLNRGGTVLIAAPFVWRVHGYPSDYWRITPNAIPILFPNIEWDEIALMAHGVKQDRTRAKTKGDICWLERTEVFAFGRKR